MKEYVYLGDVCEKDSSSVAQKDLENNDGEYNIYGASGLIKKVNFYHQKAPYIAVVKDGAGVGRTMLLPAYSSVIGTMQYILPNEKVDIDYLYYAVSHMNLSKYYMGAAIPHIYFKDYKTEKLPLPDLSTQRRIANILHSIDTVMQLYKDQLDLLDTIVKSRFIEMFGDIIHDDNIQRIVLSELVDIGSSKRIYANEYVDKGIPFYRSKEIRELGSGLKPTIELFITNERYDEIKEKYGVPKIGDILIAAIGATIGYSWIVDTNMPFYYKDGNLIILSVKNNVNSVFLNHTMSILIEDFKNKEASGSAQLALTIEKLEKMLVVNPDLSLQNQFATFVEQTDKSKLVINHEQNLLNTIIEKNRGRSYYDKL